MKTLFRIAMAVIVTVSSINMASAQINFDDPQYANYGATAKERETNMMSYSFLKDSYKMKDYDDYMARYKELVVVCPTPNVNMYKMGIRLAKEKFDAEKDAAKKAEYLKVICGMYDMQAKHYGVEKGENIKPKILYSKLLLFLGEGFEKYQAEIIATAHEVIDASGEALDGNYAIQYFNGIAGNFLDDYTMLTPEMVLNEYEYVVGAVEKSNFPEKSGVLANIDRLLLNSGAANCENLEIMFKAKYEADPNNIDLVKKILKHLDDSNCEGKFRTSLTEKYYSLDPSANAAYHLANSFLGAGDKEKGIRYLKEAISRETDKVQKSKYLQRAATIYMVDKDNKTAASYANQAVSANPSNGYAYFIIGQAYIMDVANNKVTCNDFMKRSVFWLAYDILNKAKRLTPAGDPSLKDINNAIATVKGNFPSMEDIFFQEPAIKVGDTYKVECGWIKGTTKVYNQE